MNPRTAKASLTCGLSPTYPDPITSCRPGASRVSPYPSKALQPRLRLHSLDSDAATPCLQLAWGHKLQPVASTPSIGWSTWRRRAVESLPEQSGGEQGGEQGRAKLCKASCAGPAQGSKGAASETSIQRCVHLLGYPRR